MLRRNVPSRYSRPIPASKLPPLSNPKPKTVVTVTMGAALAALLAGCADARSPAQRAFDNCVARVADPTGCAIAIEQVYGDQTGRTRPFPVN